MGISFGIDRIFSITKARMAAQKATVKPRKNDVDVFVMAFGGGKDFTGLLKERGQVTARLWNAGIKVRQPSIFARASCLVCRCIGINNADILHRPSSFTRLSPSFPPSSRLPSRMVFHSLSSWARYVFFVSRFLYSRINLNKDCRCDFLARISPDAHTRTNSLKARCELRRWVSLATTL